MGRVDGKISIITGAASGIGRADAMRLAAEGSKVLVTDINEKAGQAVADELNRNQPGAAKFLRLDVRDERQWAETISETLRAFGRLDVLVNNAGVVMRSTPLETTLEEFRYVNAVMSEGVFLGCKHAIPAMRRTGGSIINMSSVASELGYAKFLSYCAAKGAVRSMTKAIAAYCKKEGMGIRCNSVHPGAIDTPIGRAPSGQHGIQRSKRTPDFADIGMPEDVANLVLFLASDESRFMNGAELYLDNAMTSKTPS